LLLHLKLESKITNLIMDCSFQNWAKIYLFTFKWWKAD
jgi:hypothetical protein